ncbi:MAG: HPr(Ser) kinase/phosphatase [Candidatus Sumerlaeota bacterium]|nr:HPr(Ser) kinase/phosphatase [Candidatus Sumerlaeota bacterium]
MLEGEYIPVRLVLERLGDELDLKLVAGEGGLNNTFNTAELNRPGLAFAGFYEVFTSDRIQILGITEISFLKSLEPADRLQRIRRTFEFNIPAAIVTSDLEIPDELVQVANERGIPLMSTTLLTSAFSSDLSRFLQREVAPTWHVHGVAMDVFGMGVLITGPSGVGKSECALELIERGHRLIADDVVILRRIGKNDLSATASERLGYHMEIRGIGIIDVETLFGVRSVRDETVISLVIRMERWDAGKEYDRIGISSRNTLLFDCEVPEYVIPVQPGRNMSLLVEVATLTQRLKGAGVNPAEAFNERLQAELQRRGRGRPRIAPTAMNY